MPPALEITNRRASSPTVFEAEQASPKDCLTTLTWNTAPANNQPRFAPKDPTIRRGYVVRPFHPYLPKGRGTDPKLPPRAEWRVLVEIRKTDQHIPA